MNSRLPRLVPAVVAMALLLNNAAAQSLPPMLQPTIEVGDKVLGINEFGSEVSYELTGNSGSSRTWASSDGCKWTEPSTGFAPATEWSNCNGRSGTAFVDFVGNDRPYPLKVGVSWEYNIQGGNWNDARKCKVVGTETVKVPLETFDTFKIVCVERNSTRTYYVSPKLQRSVKYVRTGLGETKWSLKKILVNKLK